MLCFRMNIKNYLVLAHLTEICFQIDSIKSKTSHKTQNHTSICLWNFNLNQQENHCLGLKVNLSCLKKKNLNCKARQKHPYIKSYNFYDLDSLYTLNILDVFNEFPFLNRA